jgi:DNA repair exonuclease SbcCD ATPase subunit
MATITLGVKMAEQAKEMVKEATPTKKAFMSRPYSQDERLKKDEAELEQLLKEQKGEQEAPTEEVKEEEPKSAEEKTFKKRYGDLRRHTQEKEKDFQKQIDELKSQLSQATTKEMKLPKSDEDIDAWAKEYPDVAKIVETIAMKKAREQSEDLEKKLKEINEFNQTTKKEKAEVELMRIHPDFDQIRESDDFHNWAEEQPKWVQNALYENQEDAKSAARAIDLYKVDRGITANKASNNDKEAATQVKTKASKTNPTVDGTKKIKESDVQKMSANEYEKKSDVIMEAIRSGNFIYDVSGSAR